MSDWYSEETKTEDLVRLLRAASDDKSSGCLGDLFHLFASHSPRFSYENLIGVCRLQSKRKEVDLVPGEHITTAIPIIPKNFFTSIDIKKIDRHLLFLVAWQMERTLVIRQHNKKIPADQCWPYSHDIVPKDFIEDLETLKQLWQNQKSLFLAQLVQSFGSREKERSSVLRAFAIFVIELQQAASIESNEWIWFQLLFAELVLADQPELQRIYSQLLVGKKFPAVEVENVDYIDMSLYPFAPKWMRKEILSDAEKLRRDTILSIQSIARREFRDNYDISCTDQQKNKEIKKLWREFKSKLKALTPARAKKMAELPPRYIFKKDHKENCRLFSDSSKRSSQRVKKIG